MNLRLKKVSVLLNLLINIFFLPATIFILIDVGGPMGFGYLVLFLTIPQNIVLYFAFSSIKNKNYDTYYPINLIGNFHFLFILLLSIMLFLL